MENKTKRNIALTMIGIGVGFFLIGIFLYVTTAQTLTEKVDCYDRWNNKIIGQTCLEESLEGQGDMLIYLSTALIIIGLLTLWDLASSPGEY